MGFKLTILGAGIAALVSALAVQLDRGGSTPSSSPTPTQVVESSRTAAKDGYASLVHALDQRIESLQARVAGRDDDWLTRMHLGNALLERASLSNDLEDFERVQAVLDECFAIAPEGSGPLLLAARFNLAVHRLAKAEVYLDKMDRRAMPKAEERAAGRVMRAEIALARGEYAEALAMLTEIAAAAPGLASVELALYHAKTGGFAEAEALFEEALAATTKKDPRRRAWIRMQLGLMAMQRGQSLVALEHLQAADAELPGWWLVQEHVAAVHDRLGEHGRAIAIYEGLLEQRALPQLMDALASAYQHAGQGETAAALIERAGAVWTDQIARMPEAAMGHGLEHELQFGSATRALELAQANVAMRPGGDAQVGLARAYLQAGRMAEALVVIEGVLGTPYRTAGVHDVAAKAYAGLGMVESARGQEELRAGIHPAYVEGEHVH